MSARTINEIMELYRWAYQETIPAFKRMERYAAAYDGIIDTAAWPTLSEIPVNTFFVMVEQALPFTMEYLYPDKKMLTLIPSGGRITTEQIDKVQRMLHHTLRYGMKLRQTQEPTIRDTYKLGVGYGLVEPKIIYPQTEYIAQVWEGGEKQAEERYLGAGQGTLVSSYRYLSPGQCIPLPGKAEVETSDGYFILEILTENEVDDLYIKNPGHMKASADEIVTEARRERFDSRLDLASFLAKLGGKDMRLRPQQRQYMPLVPILKFYEPHGEYWIANGRTLIFQKLSKATIRGPLVKASAWPDGQRWFPVGIAEAAERLHYGINVYFNALMDLFTDHWHPQRIVNKRMVPDDAPRDPYADINSYGDPSMAIGYVQRPQINPAVFTIGDMLQNFQAQVTGQPRGLNGSGAPGLVRSGANSFESLMQTPLGREKIAAAHLETGMLDQTIELTIILEQALIGDDGKRFPIEKWDAAQKKKYFDQEEVTRDDLNNVWQFRLDLREKLRSSAADFAQRSGIFDRLIKTGAQYCDIKELITYLTDDERVAQQLMLPAEVVAQRQQEEQKMTMMERAAAVRKQAGPEAPVEGDIQNVPAPSNMPQPQMQPA